MDVSDEEEAFVPKKPFIKEEDSETVRIDQSERKVALTQTMEFLRKNFQGFVFFLYIMELWRFRTLAMYNNNNNNSEVLLGAKIDRPDAP